MDLNEIKQRVLEDVDPLTRKKKKREKRIRIIKTVLEFTGMIVAIMVIFRIVVGMSPVEGSSMYPTLHDKDTVFYSRLTKIYGKGDIVAIQRPNDVMYVKRVVAIAGDTINIEDGKLYINGKKQNEPYVMDETERAKNGVVFPITIKEGEVFVLGDNRTISEDSRMFGPIKISDTKGKLIGYIGIF